MHHDTLYGRGFSFSTQVLVHFLLASILISVYCSFFFLLLQLPTVAFASPWEPAWCKEATTKSLGMRGPLCRSVAGHVMEPKTASNKLDPATSFCQLRHSVMKPVVFSHVFSSAAWPQDHFRRDFCLLVLTEFVRTVCAG